MKKRQSSIQKTLETLRIAFELVDVAADAKAREMLAKNNRSIGDVLAADGLTWFSWDQFEEAVESKTLAKALQVSTQE